MHGISYFLYLKHEIHIRKNFELQPINVFNNKLVSEGTVVDKKNATLVVIPTHIIVEK